MGAPESFLEVTPCTAMCVRQCVNTDLILSIGDKLVQAYSAADLTPALRQTLVELEACILVHENTEPAPEETALQPGLGLSA